eukprot:jgi/Ulvmu1/5322/UM022_0116.1
MVHSVCTLQSSGQGVCHSVAAHWLQPRKEGRFPNLVVVRTTELAVYSVCKHDVLPGNSKEGSDNSHVPRHTLQLEFSQELYGEVMSMACLNARRQNYRDSIVLAFESGQVSVLAWDVKKHCPVPTSLHMFNMRQLPIRSKTIAVVPPVAAAEPSGRCVAILLHQSVLAVLPAVSPGVSQQVSCMHSAAAVGNSFVIDLASHGIRSARDVAFLHEADAVAIVLFETDHTWAGSLYRKKDTCAVKALAINAAGKKQPVLWASKRLPSDCFAVRAVPSGGVLILSPSLIIFQNKSKRISLATGGSAIPGAVPDTMDALLDTQELAAQQAVQLAQKFATNVAPAIVPEAAGRARLADLQADLAHCRLTFLSTHSALVALDSGRLLQLSLQVEAGDRVCGIALKAVGNASPPSTVAFLTPSLVFLGSWLGHSNVVSFEFKSTEPQSPRERNTDAKPDGAAATGREEVSPESPASTTATQRIEPAAATPLPTCTVEPASDGAAGAAAADGAPTEGPDMAAAAVAAGQDAVVSGAADDTQETGGATLDSLLSQMQGAADGPPGVAVAAGAVEETAAPAAEVMVKRERESADLLDSEDAPADAAQAPALKLQRVAVVEAEAAAAAVPPPPPPESPRQGILPGLPFAGFVNSAVPGLPGLGAARSATLSSAPSQVLTEVPEAPLGEGGAPSSDDDSDLEAALYHPPEQELHAAGRLDAGTLFLYGEDRLAQLGPIAAFAIGTPAVCGSRRDGTPLVRGAPQLLACVGAGRSGALAAIHGGILPQQDASVDFRAEGRCTGVWGLRFGSRAGLLSTEHTFMVLAFERSTYVYQFTAGQGPRVVSDTRACEWHTDMGTVYACTMFDGDGVVQVCATSATILAGLERVAVWRLKQAQLPTTPRPPTVLSACHSQHYLLLRLDTGSAVLLRQADDEAALEVVPGAPAVTYVDPSERTELHIAASCLYRDHSGWLTRTLQQSQPEAVEGADATYLVLCRCNGTLEIFSLPHVLRVATFLELHEGDDAVHAVPPPAREQVPVRPPPEFRVLEVRLDSYVPAAEAQAHALGGVPSPLTLQAPRPLLLARCQDERLYVYRLQAQSAADGSGSAAGLCLRRQPMEWLRHAEPRDPKRPCGNPHDSMVRFEHVAVEHSTAAAAAEALHQGVFVCGAQPMWLLAHRGSYRAHMLDNLEPADGVPAAGVAAPAMAPASVAAMAAWNQGKARNTFVMVTAETSELRFCRMPKNLRLNMPAPARYKGISISDKDRKKHEGVTPHKAAWHGPSQLFFVATSRRMPFMHHLPPAEDAQEDPHAAFAYKLAEEVARAQRGEVRYQIRGVTRDTLATACEVRMKPLETILSLETVKLSVPASGDAGPSTAVFVAAGVGSLVTEDWSSQGAVHLFSVAKEQTQTAEGAFVEQWQLQPVYRREVAGPVTALSASDGRLVVAYGHNVELYKWTGTQLQLALPAPAACSLVTSVAIIKQQYLLVGNTRRGVAFLQAKEGELKLVSRDFGVSDALAVEFLLAGPALAFLEADTRGRLRVFKYHRDDPYGYDPPGIRAAPVGAFHVGHRVTALRRCICQVDDLPGKSKIGYAALFTASSGALGCVMPIAADTHDTLAALCRLLRCRVPHCAGLNPQAFRAAQHALDGGYRQPPPPDGILDGQLLREYSMQPRRQQDSLAAAAGVTMRAALQRLRMLALNSTFY